MTTKEQQPKTTTTTISCTHALIALINNIVQEPPPYVCVCVPEPKPNHMLSAALSMMRHVASLPGTLTYTMHRIKLQMREAQALYNMAFEKYNRRSTLHTLLMGNT